MFSLYNVVYYDGDQAYTTKFILESKETESEHYITADAEEKLDKYMEGNGEVLTVDCKIFHLDLSEITALQEGKLTTRFDFSIPDQMACFERFNEMYF